MMRYLLFTLMLAFAGEACAGDMPSSYTAYSSSNGTTNGYTPQPRRGR